MASVDVPMSGDLLLQDALPKRKPLKTSELPLNAAQRATIDSLLHTIKKKGEFDFVRKRIWSQYTESEAKTAFTNSLTDLAEAEIEREPSLLSRDRGKAATLIEGAVDRSTLYKAVETSIDALISEHISHAEAAARDIRRLEVGEELAADEEKRGAKTEEEYAQEAAMRRAAREKARKAKRMEEEKERLRAEERAKRLELERLREAGEKRKEEEARAEKRRLEREAEEAAKKKRDEEREAERRAERDRRRKEIEEEEERERELARERLRTRRKSREEPEEVRDRLKSKEPDIDSMAWGGDELHAHPSQSRYEDQEPEAPSAIFNVDEKSLEETALELLLREGRELAAKSIVPQTDGDRDASLEPPSRRGNASRSKPSDSPFRNVEDSRETSRHDVRRSRIPTEPRALSLKHESGRHRSRTHSRHRVASEAKELWKENVAKHHEREPEVHMRSTKERSRSRSPGRVRDRGGERERDRERRERYGREEGEYVPSSSHRKHRSRSRERDADRRSKYEKYDKYDKYEKYERGYDKEKDRERDRDRDRDRDRERERERERDRDRDRERERRYHDDRPKYEEKDYEDKKVISLKDQVEIDRYVPGGGPVKRDAAGRERERERDAGRERERERERDGRDRERESVKPREREDGARPREREDGSRRHHHRDDRDRERDRPRERERERDGEGKTRYPDNKSKYPEEKRSEYVHAGPIDRYVPPGGSGPGGGIGEPEEDGKRRRRSSLR